MKLEKRAEEKKQEILEIAKDRIANYSPIADELARKVFDSFCVITPPETDDRWYLITTRPGGIGGGRSSKPGNIWLNWRKLLIDSAESILTVVGAIAIPWLIPLAGLIVWNKVWALSNLEMDERHAATIWTMWKNRDKENRIEHDIILNLVNEELSKYKRSPMGEEELKNILNDLEKMECIEKDEKNKWWLREWVKTTYE